MRNITVNLPKNAIRWCQDDSDHAGKRRGETSESQIKLAKIEAQGARIYADNITETLREPLLVLNAEMQVLSTNRFFYTTSSNCL